jgi:hypothetical protein
MFIAHPKSIQLFKRFNDVLILDCTYKTNRYNKPVLNIVGVTGSNKTIQVALCLVDGESEDEFIWALQQLKALLAEYEVPEPKLFLTDRQESCIKALWFVFPEGHQRVCLWHINKDVHAYHIKHLGTRLDPSDPEKKRMIETEQGEHFYAAYQQAMHAKTEAAFAEALASIQTIWPKGYTYLRNTWFNRFADGLASFVLNEVLHFGIASTSRVEGSHSSLKKWLHNSRADIHGFVTRLTPWWNMLFANTETHLHQQEEKGAITTSGRFYQRVQRVIWRFALNKVVEEYEKASNQIIEIQRQKSAGVDPSLITIEPCTGTFRSTMGLPCRHEIRDLRRQNRSLLPKHFHVHWWINPPEGALPEEEYVELLEPQTMPRTKRKTNPSRGKQTGTGVWGNRRDPLSVEAIEIEQGLAPDLRSTRSSSQPMRTASSRTSRTLSPYPQPATQPAPQRLLAVAPPVMQPSPTANQRPPVQNINYYHFYGQPPASFVVNQQVQAVQQPQEYPASSQPNYTQLQQHLQHQLHVPSSSTQQQYQQPVQASQQASQQPTTHVPSAQTNPHQQHTRMHRHPYQQPAEYDPSALANPDQQPVLQPDLQDHSVQTNSYAQQPPSAQTDLYSQRIDEPASELPYQMPQYPGRRYAYAARSCFGP